MKTAIFALVASALVAGTVNAAPKTDQNREEGMGLGAGGIAGAILGGPVGFIIGAATGAWTGNKFHKQREARTEAEARAADMETVTRSLEALVADSENEIQQLSVEMRRQQNVYRDALREAFEVEVYFHTGEAALAQNVADRVERLGEILQGVDDFAVVVEGHADPRGDNDFNEQLSAQRAAAVRDALIRAGISDDRITTRAVGESQSAATEGDLDAMALERRVNLSIVYPLSRENRVARQ